MDLRNKWNTNRGVTLTEIMIVVMILAFAFFLGVQGIMSLNGLSRTKEQLQYSQEAELQQFQIGHDIRNSRRISWTPAAPGTLVLSTFYTRQGFDDNTAPIFNPAYFGTVTYRYVTTATESYLERTDEHFDGTAMRTTVSKSLRNELQAPTTTDYIFYADTSDNPTTIHVRLRFMGGFHRTLPQTYESIYMRRSLVGQT